MAKTALIVKAKRKPKFEVRGIHSVHPLWSPACRLPEVRPLPYLLPIDGAQGRTARHHQVKLVTIYTP